MLGDNILSLKKIPENSVDSIVTDPPYGLSFMGKKWDYDVPSVEFWKEVYRVLKPGGHVLSFGGTRTYHRMVVNIEDAGFEIRDQIMWLYGSGFPKSHNIGKSVDKLQGNDREVVGEVKQPRMNNDFGKGNHNERKIKELDITKGQSPYEGWGTALKPANEPICVARKPLSEKTIAENVIKWGTGGINIDGCRIGTDDKLTRPNVNGYKDNSIYSNKQINGGDKNGIFDDYGSIEGRFPANIILECLCDEVIKGEKGGLKEFHRKDSGSIYGGGKGLGDTKGNYISGDKGDIHTNPMCPCRLLDEQSGVLKSGAMNGEYNNTIMKNEPGIRDGKEVKLTSKASSGGASRFFYQAKVSKAERNMGLDGFETKITPNSLGALGRKSLEDRLEDKSNPIISKNNHPTIKPVSLMAYLCRLVTPPNGIVLDPFMGSGSTGIAAQLEGFRFVGMEMDGDYFKIAEARINSYEEYRKFIK